MTRERLDHGDQLGDRLRRLARWCDHVPHHARPQVSAQLDKLAVLIGEVVDHEDDPTQ